MLKVHNKDTIVVSIDKQSGVFLANFESINEIIQHIIRFYDSAQEVDFGIQFSFLCGI